MSDSYVCSGATMRCTMGTSPARLTVLPVRTVYLTGQPMANISDHKSMVNLAPFGLCRSLGYPATASATAANHGPMTPMPFMHNTPMPWMNGKMDYLIKGQPALLKSCKCQCMWGGTISLVTDGQVGEGTQYVQKKPKESFEPTLSQFVYYDIEDGSFMESDELGENKASQNAGTDATKDTKPTLPQKKPSTPEELAEYNRVADIVLKRCEDLSDADKQRIINMVNEMPNNLSNLEKLAIAESNLRIEKLFGKQKGQPKSIEEADSSHANPHNLKYVPDSKGTFVDTRGNHYKPNPSYHSSDDRIRINSATTAPTYFLRLRGFDITAKGKVRNSGSLNEEISKGKSFKLWKNIDGTPAQPVLTTDWMKSKGYESMNKERYLEYFEETCAEEGVYVLTIKWKNRQELQPDGKIKTIDTKGHATILQRDSDGKLYYIEPQTYNYAIGAKRPISQLAEKGMTDPAWLSGKGVMRVDNKLFNADYVSLFNS